MKIGFIGLGIMGEAMSANIVSKHDDTVYVFDFVKEQVDKIAALGAVACASSNEVAQQADVIISMVPKSEHVKSVYEGILPDLKAGKICIDMSTIDPDVSVEVSKMVKATGAQFADAPVVKSKPAAVAGVLGIYVGCDEALYQTLVPILSYMGNNVVRMGENGNGLVMKICHNTLVAQIQNGVNETISLAKRMGIDEELFATAISYGGGQNFYLDGKAKAIKEENWATAFSVENMAKDLGICQTLSAQQNFPMPGMENAKKVYDKAIEMGFAKEDFCATVKAVR